MKTCIFTLFPRRLRNKVTERVAIPAVCFHLLNWKSAIKTARRVSFNVIQSLMPPRNTFSLMDADLYHPTARRKSENLPPKNTEIYSLAAYRVKNQVDKLLILFSQDCINFRYSKKFKISCYKEKKIQMIKLFFSKFIYWFNFFF